MSRFQADLTINLHGFTAEAALLRVRRTLETGRYRGKTVLIIHGFGQGKIREAVRRWAADSSMVKTVWPGEDFFLDGGGGVTALFL